MSPVHFDEGFWLVRLDSGETVAISDMDTHPGMSGPDCQVDWRPDLVALNRKGWFHGRCSGSNFELDGRLASGPSPRNLDRYAVSVDANQITVDTTSVLASNSPLEDRRFVIEDSIRLVERHTGNKVDASSASATKTTAAQALEAIAAAGGSTYQGGSLAPMDQEVWLIKLEGEFVGIRPLTIDDVARHGTLFIVLLRNGAYGHVDIVYE
jgi:hypothetical protein